MPVCICFLLSAFCFPVFAQPFSVGWFKVAGGGGTSTNAEFTVSGTFGQHDAGGPMNGPGFSVSSGFWSRLSQQTSPLTGDMPSIVSQPQNQFLNYPSANSLSVSVSGSPPFFYQWQKNGVNLPDGGLVSGSTSSNLAFSLFTPNDGGSYRLIIANAYGSLTSSVVKLTLIVPDHVYTITNLGNLGYHIAYAMGINSNGQVAGYTFLPDPVWDAHAFRYSSGTMSDLGSLGNNALRSEGFAINSSGQVAGVAYYALVANAAIFSGGTINNLGTLEAGGTFAFGINDSGQVVGYTIPANHFNYSAFLYSGGVFTNLGTLGGSSSFASGINNDGQVVGRSETPYSIHAFKYSNGVMTDLGTLGGTFSSAGCINNQGQIAGVSSVSGGNNTHLFLYNNGTMTDLGTLYNDGEALGINNAGQIVGKDNYRAFIYDGGTIVDLNRLVPTNGFNAQFVLNDARGINDSGQIIANGEDFSQPFPVFGGRYAYLLTPTLPKEFLTPILPYVNSSLSGKFPPALQTATLSGGQFGFTWGAPNTFPPVSYQVQYTTNLTQPSWINLGGVIASPGFTNAIGANSQCFYRVQIVQ